MNNTLEQAKKDAANNLKKAREEAAKLKVRFSETKIPETKMIPSPMRIYTLAVEAEEYKTESGIIIAPSYQAGARENEQKTQT